MTPTPLLDALRPHTARWRWKTSGWVLAAWTLVGFFRAADRYFSDPFQRQRLEFGLWEALAQSLLAAYIWAALTPAVVALAKRSLPSRTHWIGPVSRLLAVGLVLPLVHTVVYQLTYPLLMGFPLIMSTQLAAVERVLPVVFPTHFVTFCGIVGATWTILYSRLSRERDLRTSLMKTRVAKARLEALKMQLHPHFLFNTLNSILPLVFRDRDAASRTVVRLGDLLRLSLQNEANDLITLRKEIEVLQVYLEIQQTRFQDRLTVRLDVEDEVKEALVPNLILQPLVENAIKHGIAAKPGAGRIEIRAVRESGRLSLRVCDDGPGPGDGTRREGSREGGVGLRNTRDRLELLYAKDHAFAFEGSPDRGCQVSLSFPLTYAPPPPARAAARDEESRLAASASPVRSRLAASL